MIKKIAIENVHIRSGEPYRGFDNKKGVLYKGFELIIKEEISGENIRGNDKWYKDQNGDYYWSGGFLKDRTDEINHDNSHISFDWKKNCQFVPDEWLETDGKNVRIGILDSGIWINHPNFHHLSQKNSNHFHNACDSNYKDTFQVYDKTGHGSACCGIIAAKAKNGVGINGIATESELFISKVRHELYGKSTEYFINAMDHLLQHDVEIISISVEFGDYTSSKFDYDITRIFTELSKRNITVVVAARDNDELLKKERQLFPLNQKGVIGVGCISEDFFNKNPDPSFSENVDYLFPLIPMPTVVETDDLPMGSSFAAPLLAGIIANTVAYKRTLDFDFIPSKKNIISLINEISLNYQEFESNKIQFYKSR